MISHPRRMLALAAVFLLAAGGAQAQGHGQNKGHEKGAKELRTDGRDQGRVIVRDGRDDQRGGPPGLAKKPGGMPPGQYKKHYSAQQGSSVLRDILITRGYTVVRMQNAGDTQYVYYRLRDGSVRRAVVSPGAEQLSFSNLPQALVREVLIRLY